jgi:nucleoid DNA-binding protein
MRAFIFPPRLPVHFGGAEEADEMTKAELIARVHSRKMLPRDLTKKTVAQIVDFVFTEMGDYFIRAKATRGNGAKLTYPGFGTFSKRHRPERAGRHPQNGTPITIPAQYTVTFLPGAELKSLLNRNVRSKVPGNKQNPR